MCKCQSCNCNFYLYPPPPIDCNSCNPIYNTNATSATGIQLTATTPQLWADQAWVRLKQKNINTVDLSKQFTQVIYPWCSNYNNYRYLYQLQISELPLFVIVAYTESDVTRALDLLKEYNLQVRIMAGRHSSVVIDPDFYLDMSNFDKITLTSKNLIVGGGLNQGRVYDFLSRQSIGSTFFPSASKFYHPLYSLHIQNLRRLSNGAEYAFPGGSAGSVGVSGLTSAGGVGSFRRTLGLGCDYVVNFKIALPPTSSSKSKVIYASNTSNNDLFWALRGGVASNFGAVMEIGYDLVTVGTIISYSITYNWSQASIVLSTWLDNALTRPNQYNEDIGLFTYKKKTYTEQGLSVGGLYVIPEGQSVADAIIAVQNELSVMIGLGGSYTYRVVKYSQAVEGLAGNRTYTPFSVARIFYTATKPDVTATINKMNEALSIEGLHLFGIELLGGAIEDVPSDGTAYYPRTAPYFMDNFSYWDSSLDNCENIKWTDELFQINYVDGRDNVFVGFPINDLPNHLDSYYATNKTRLLSIKEEMDPLHLLRFPSGLIEE